jgi:hypothetical protein
VPRSPFQATGAVTREGQRTRHVARWLRGAPSVWLPVLVTVSNAELRLLQCPEGMQQPVWDVVALAALSSMEVGCRRLRGGVAPDLMCAQLVGDFWGRLRSFVAMGRAPASWAGVPPSHPFIGRSPDGSLVLNR